MGRSPACWLAMALLWSGLPAAGSEISLPQPRESAAITVRAQRANRWQEGAYEVWMLRGGCQIVQDTLTARSEEAVIWIRRGAELPEATSKVLAYLEGGVVLENRPVALPAGSAVASDIIRDRRWLGRLTTSAEVTIDAPVTGFQPLTKPALYERGLAAWDPGTQGDVRPAQYLTPPPGNAPPGANQPLGGTSTWPPPTFPSAPGLPPHSSPGTLSETPGPMPAYEAVPARPSPQPTARRILIRSRSSVRMQGRADTSPDGRETIAYVTSGVNVIVEGIENVPGLMGDKIDIEADRIVIWTATLESLAATGESAIQRLQPQDAPLEFYMEGNIVFREGDRVIYAERMYYNVPRRAGIVLNAEILTPAPEYQGLIRLKADVLQQMDAANFRAYGAAVTSSRMGVPRYWLQAEQIDFRDQQRPLLHPLSGQPVIDPETGDPAIDHDYLVTSQNNFVYLYEIPVLYWPVMATDLERPTYYVNSLRIRNDQVFGAQIYPNLDMYQLLGVRQPPEGTRWSFSPDYLSDRGFALGTQFTYDRFGQHIPGPSRGILDIWGIRDEGLDNLGLDRRAVVPAREDRGRVLWQHRHEMAASIQSTAEVGWISDRNFLEQYYEAEWDQSKDQTTGLEVKQYLDSASWSVSADVRLNDFVTQTEWLPRVDHFLLGISPWDHFTWSAHSHAGYARLRTAELPPPGSEPPQVHLPWETDTSGVPYEEREGLRAATRQELALPLSLGPFRVVPYALGELAFWGEDRDAAELERAYGQVGVRGSLPFWSVNQTVQSTLWNVNGIAHKVSLDADFFVADSTAEFERLPLYDPLDDDSTEHFRRRFIPNIYGGVLPAQFDERYYAFRSGLQNWVTAPVPEIADELMVVQGGIRQRWQTRRGAPGRERAVDWIVLDVEGSYFPKADRDNFGESFGLLNYDFRWHLGDRFTLLSDGFADLFTDGLRTASVGGMLSRPLRGSVYLGFRTIGGPIQSNRVTTTVNYRMSEKWILNAGAAYDFSEAGNLGESLSFTRIGESMLLRVGFNVDHSRDNFGIAFAIEPRFLSGDLSRVGGVPLPPVGAFGVE